MMRKGMCTAALCALLMGGTAVAAEDAIDTGAIDGAPAVATPPATGAAAAAPATTPAGGAFARMPPGAEPEAVPAPPPLAEDGAVAVPEGNGTNVEAPAEDRAADEAPAATGEDAGSRI